MDNKQKGQSIIEAVFLIGALAVVLSGVVVLMLSAMNSRTRGFDRKKAAELAERQIERLVDEKTNRPAEFWEKTGEEQPSVGVDEFSYKINFVDKKDILRCRAECVDAIIEVSWVKDIGQTMVFSRFFSR